jgi:hypothetical protein
MAAIIELTPLTHQGRKLLSKLERRTGLSPVQINDASGGRAYYLEAWANVDGFEAALGRIDPNWGVHLMRRYLSRTE